MTRGDQREQLSERHLLAGRGAVNNRSAPKSTPHNPRWTCQSISVVIVWLRYADSRGTPGYPLPEPVRRAELLVGTRRLLRVVGCGVAPHHVRGGVAEEVLDVQLPGLVLDRPGGEGVTKPVGVDLGHAGLAAQAAQHLLHTIVLERLVASGVAEHGTGAGDAKPVQKPGGGQDDQGDAGPVGLEHGTGKQRV